MANSQSKTAANGKVVDTREGSQSKVESVVKTWTYGGEVTTVPPTICELVNMVRLGGLQALNAFGGERNAKPRAHNLRVLTGKAVAPKEATLEALKKAYAAWVKLNRKVHIPKTVKVGDPDYAEKAAKQGKAQHAAHKKVKAEKAERKAKQEQAKNEPVLLQLAGSKVMKSAEYVEAKKLLTIRFKDGKTIKHAPVKSITVTYMKASKDLDRFYESNLQRLAA